MGRCIGDIVYIFFPDPQLNSDFIRYRFGITVGGTVKNTCFFHKNSDLKLL